MPWKEFPMHEQRSAFVHLVRSLYYSVSQAAREFGVSRKTAHKWLARYKEDPDIPLLDRSRRPSRSPARSDAVLEQKTLEVRKQFGWGPRKIRAYLINQKLHEGPLPSVRTFANILSRSGCIHPQSSDPSPSQQPVQVVLVQPEEGVGEQEVADLGAAKVEDQRPPVGHLALARVGVFVEMRPVEVVQPVDVFGEVGLPKSLLCDNALWHSSDGARLKLV